MALTDIKIRNTKASVKAVKLMDGFGMYLLIHPNGSKYWRMQYRFGGKQNLWYLACILPSHYLMQGNAVTKRKSCWRKEPTLL